MAIAWLWLLYERILNYGYYMNMHDVYELMWTWMNIEYKNRYMNDTCLLWIIDWLSLMAWNSMILNMILLNLDGILFVTI